MELQSYESFAWAVMAVCSVLGMSFAFRVVRIAIGAAAAAAAVKDLSDQYVRHGDRALREAARDEASAKSQPAQLLIAVAIGDVGALQARVHHAVDDQFGGTAMRALAACSRLGPLCGLFGTCLGLLVHFTVIGNGKGFDASAAGLALKTTAAGIGLGLVFMSIATFVGEPAVRRIRRAYVNAAFTVYEHRVLQQNKALEPAAAAAAAVRHAPSAANVVAAAARTLRTPPEVSTPPRATTALGAARPKPSGNPIPGSGVVTPVAGPRLPADARLSHDDPRGLVRAAAAADGADECGGERFLC